jgi:IMP cyclohydrolase
MTKFVVVRTSSHIAVGKTETLAEANALAKKAAMDMQESMTVVPLKVSIRTTRTPVAYTCVLRMKSGHLVNNGKVFTRDEAIAMSEMIHNLGHARPTVVFCK